MCRDFRDTERQQQQRQYGYASHVIFPCYRDGTGIDMGLMQRAAYTLDYPNNS